MSELSQVKEQVYTDVAAAVSGYTSNVDSHVIKEDDDEPDEPPMVALSGTDRSRSSQNVQTGIHGVRVIDVLSSPFDVKYGRERTFSVDVTITDIDGDRADNILDDIENAFTFYPRFRDASDFLNSVLIEDVRVQDTSPTNRDQRIGHALSIEIDWVRTFLYSEVDDPPTEVTKVVQEFNGGDITITTSESGTSVSE